MPACQLELFNERDRDNLANLYTEEAVLSDLQTHKVLAQGKEAIREYYCHLFESPVQCVLLGRLSIGHVVRRAHLKYLVATVHS